MRTVRTGSVQYFSNLAYTFPISTILLPYSQWNPSVISYAQDQKHHRRGHQLMINCIMKKVLSNKNFFMAEIQAVKTTPVRENALNLVMKKGLGQI